MIRAEHEIGRDPFEVVGHRLRAHKFVQIDQHIVVFVLKRFQTARKDDIPRIVGREPHVELL